MSYKLDIPLPSETGRRLMFKINLKEVIIDEKIDWDYLVKVTSGYSGADIANVCREAALMPLKKVLMENSDIMRIPEKRAGIERPITMEDFTMAVQNIQKSVSNEYLQKYDLWMKEYGSK